ncbi:hypothetical protein ACP70R_037539 [Stipagrostis hirtigluma subsp. patula]
MMQFTEDATAGYCGNYPLVKRIVIRYPIHRGKRRTSGKRRRKGEKRRCRSQPPAKRPTASPPTDQVVDNVLETVLQFLDAPWDRSAASLVYSSWHRAEATTHESVAVRIIPAAFAARTGRHFPNARGLLLKAPCASPTSTSSRPGGPSPPSAPRPPLTVSHSMLPFWRRRSGGGLSMSMVAVGAAAVSWALEQRLYTTAAAPSGEATLCQGASPLAAPTRSISSALHWRGNRAGREELSKESGAAEW